MLATIIANVSYGLMPAAAIWAVFGIIIMAGSFWFLDRIVLRGTDVWGEIVDHKNNAMAIMVAGFLIGVALIIAAVVN
jgi:hypothetical protein